MKSNKSGKDPNSQSGNEENHDPFQIARERLNKGEITAQEYDAIIKTLEEVEERPGIPAQELDTCYHCGFKIPSAVKTCPNCGVELIAAAEGLKNGQRRVWFWVGSCLGATALGLMILLLLGKGRGERRNLSSTEADVSIVGSLESAPSEATEQLEDGSAVKDRNNPPDCPEGPSTRLYPDAYAYVSFEPSMPNRVRRGPSLSYEQQGKIYPGTTIVIIEGPECDDGYFWWKVRELTTGMTGWTAEGDIDNYWLVPCKAEECP